MDQRIEDYSERLLGFGLAGLELFVGSAQHHLAAGLIPEMAGQAALGPKDSVEAPVDPKTQHCSEGHCFGFVEPVGLDLFADPIRHHLAAGLILEMAGVTALGPKGSVEAPVQYYEGQYLDLVEPAGLELFAGSALHHLAAGLIPEMVVQAALGPKGFVWVPKDQEMWDCFEGSQLGPGLECLELFAGSAVKTALVSESFVGALKDPRIWEYLDLNHFG
ncbi:hypothetical protein CDD81_1362 [Ophiocordyceps australis]|uniref:Uncharacterized protein n=1 Tax=Ophiocordyceps australis TaxID=1399860 RepID=A0A2C5XZ27_9HYPO|nr:hypothetical protein CDD81_1362 [Ophiocordyceps australis]